MHTKGVMEANCSSFSSPTLLPLSLPLPNSHSFIITRLPVFPLSPHSPLILQSNPPHTYPVDRLHTNGSTRLWLQPLEVHSLDLEEYRTTLHEREGHTITLSLMLLSHLHIVTYTGTAAITFN